MDATEAYTRLWRVIRANRNAWDLREISIQAGVAEHVAEGYVFWLRDTGLVRDAGQADGHRLYRSTMAGRETVFTPEPGGIELVRLEFVREVATGAIRLVSESSPGAFDRIRAALTGPVESHKWLNKATIRDRLWAALRAAGGRVASSTELAGLAQAKATTAQDYLRDLARAGLVAYGPDGWRATGELPAERPQAPDRRTIRRKGVQS